MKHSITALLLSILFVVASNPTFAQKRNPSRGYSIEVSSGYPPISGLIASFGIGIEDFPQYEKDSQGIVERNKHAQQLNVAFKWDRSYRWDMVAMIGVTSKTYNQYKYRTWTDEGTDEWGTEYGHWEGGPDLYKRHFTICNGYISGFARVKYAYTKYTHLYTSFGAGIDIAALVSIPLMPYITPIGISFGDNSNIYGFVEATLGTGATFGLAGIGIRL